MYNGDISRFPHYAMNLNTRKLIIDESKFSSLISRLENSDSDKKYNKALSYLLTKEFEYYQWTKDRRKYEVQGTRRIILGPLLGDKEGLLVTYGCCKSGYKYQYNINLMNRLDIIISACFNLDIEVVQAKLKEITEKKNISLEYLSILCLSMESSQDMLEESSVTLSDLAEIQEIQKFLLDVIKDDMYNNIPVLTNIEGVDFLPMLEISEDDSMDRLPLALMLKFLLGASKIIKSLIVKFYDYDIDGIVISSDFTKVTFGTNTPMKPLYYYTKECEIELPMKLV